MIRPGFYAAVSGTKKSPKDQGDLGGFLSELGYSKDQVRKVQHRAIHSTDRFRFSNFELDPLLNLHTMHSVPNRKRLIEHEIFSMTPCAMSEPAQVL